jgi:uncharacterized protein (TIGR03435 family)
VLALIAAVPLVFAQSAAQTAARPPDDLTLGITFGAVSIRPTSPGISHITDPPDGDGITVEHSTMVEIVQWDFNKPYLRQSQLQGVPSWFATDNYEIHAKVSDSDAAAWQKVDDNARRLIFRKVLVDRFKFAWHFADVDSPVYNLVIDKGGVKIKQAKPGEANPYNFKTADTTGMCGRKIDGTILSPTDTGISLCPAPDGYPMYVYQQTQISSIAGSLLSRLSGRQVIDKTGLTGTYNFTLNFQSEHTTYTADAPGADDSIEALREAYARRPDLATALQEQLGLKLESARGPVETMVVDHIERPSEN